MEHIPTRKTIYPSLLERIQNKENCLVATVVETHGSSPQKPGSSAILSKMEILEGTIGGGLVEYTMQKKAADRFNSRKSGLFTFELNGEVAEDSSGICGGGMTILLDAAPERHLDVFKALEASYRKRIPGVLMTVVNADPENAVIERFWITKESFNKASRQFERDLKLRLENVLEDVSSCTMPVITRHVSPGSTDKHIFLESVHPAPRLIIAGAGHVGKALAHLGKLVDFEVVVWDDRKEFANEALFPDAERVLTGQLESTLGKVVPESNTFIVIVTRGHQNDAEVLKMFMNTKAAYIGMIGSRNKIAQIKEQSLNEGWATVVQWERIYAPVGLHIHSKTVNEIALSIAAQLVQVRNQKKQGA